MSNRRASLNDVKVPSSVVKDLSVDKLKTIQDEEDSFYEYFESLDLEDIKKVQKQRVNVMEANQQVAAKTADLEPRFEDLKTQLRQKAIEAAELKAEYQKRFEELKLISSKSDSYSVLKELQKAVKDTEQSSEELADKFVAGQLEVSVDEWLRTLQEQRELYWLRKVKAEKMEELIRRKQPRPVPRSPRVSRDPTASVSPPYLAPLPQQNPGQSLPAHLQPPYPPGTRRTSDPSPGQPPPSSLPPYPQATTAMPQPSIPPGHPFPRAAFTSYQPATQNPSYYPRQPPPRPLPYASRPQRPPYGAQQSPYHSYR